MDEIEEEFAAISKSSSLLSAWLQAKSKQPFKEYLPK